MNVACDYEAPMQMLTSDKNFLFGGRVIIKKWVYGCWCNPVPRYTIFFSFDLKLIFFMLNYSV